MSALAMIRAAIRASVKASQACCGALRARDARDRHQRRRRRRRLRTGRADVRGGTRVRAGAALRRPALTPPRDRRGGGRGPADRARGRPGGAEAILRSARPLFYTTLEEAWDHAQAGTPSTLEQKAELALAGAHAVASSMKAVDLVYSLALSRLRHPRRRARRRFLGGQCGGGPSQRRLVHRRPHSEETPSTCREP